MGKRSGFEIFDYPTLRIFEILSIQKMWFWSQKAKNYFTYFISGIAVLLIVRICFGHEKSTFSRLNLDKLKGWYPDQPKFWAGRWKTRPKDWLGFYFSPEKYFRFAKSISWSFNRIFWVWFALPLGYMFRHFQLYRN